MLKTMFLAGTKRLDEKKEWINELNVFPVPDGDTGINMTLTLMNAVSELVELDAGADMDTISKTMSQGTLRGARGNSGVILSQLVRGFSKEIEGWKELDQVILAKAFDRAVKTAYKAVMKPKEGTILTVARAASEKAQQICENDLSMDEFFTEILRYTGHILEQTPEMLPVLKEAGVVDSGGQGLYEFLAGALSAYRGEEVDLTFEAGPAPAPKAAPVDSKALSTSDIKFGYCTEFIIESEQELQEEQEAELKTYLASMGDSIVCVCMDSVVKVHVHTNHPGSVIEKALTYGFLTNLKIDNMRLEHNEKVVKEAERALAAKKEVEAKTRKNEAAKKEENADAEEAPLNLEVTQLFRQGRRKEVGFVAVCSGAGLTQIFKGMSVDEVIEGGQTMNPSTEDILEAVKKVDADNVFVLPNNKNIVLAARQAAALSEDKKVIVIPTTTVCQGINAVINYVPALSIEDNTQQLTGAAAEIKTAEITYSIRDAEIDGKQIKKDDYMGLGDEGLLAVGTDRKEVAVETIRAMLDEWSELITIYYGEESSEEEAQEIADRIETEFEDVDIEVADGGQPVYSYIVSVE